jgi:hypothetical protein
MTMAGYSGTPLWQKLGIKPGNTVLLIDAPAGFEQALEGLPDDAVIDRSTRAKSPADVLVVFVTSRAALTRRFPACKPRMKPDSGLWFAWPKKASGVKTDMTEDIIRDVALAAGLVDNKVCAIDETWSGLRLVIRREDRPSKSLRK